MGSVIRLVQGGLKYGFITQFFCFMQEKALIMRQKLRGSVPLHLVRCPVMASLSIEIYIFSREGYPKTLL